jgi:hypothetical protein
MIDVAQHVKMNTLDVKVIKLVDIKQPAQVRVVAKIQIVIHKTQFVVTI